jgi:ATP-dependent Lon protease
MTGELSLTGKVLPVGGIKEKVLAARRSGADTVILPTGCKADFEELPQYVKDSVTIHFVSDYHQVSFCSALLCYHLLIV